MANNVSERGDKMTMEDERRCVDCGEFYHVDAMNGDKCLSCFEEDEDLDNE